MKLIILTVVLAVCSASPLVSTAMAADFKAKAFTSEYSVFQPVDPDYKMGKFLTTNIGLKAPDNYNLWNAKPPQKSEVTGVADCQNGQELGTGLKVKNIVNVGYKAGALAACLDIKTDVGNRFTKENCEVMKLCSSTKTSVDKPNKSSIIDIPMMMAQDLFTIRFELAADKMERVERARIYIENKFGKQLAQQCKPRFINSDPFACNKEMMDAAFKRYQNQCPMRLSCYNGADYKKSESSYENNRPKNETGSFIVSYLNARSASAINESLVSDEDLVQGLDQIIGQEQNQELRLKGIHQFLSVFIAKGRLDPILGFEARNDSTFETFKKSPHFKFFENLSHGKSNSAAIRKSLDTYRDTLASGILKSECNDAPTLQTLCEESTRTSLGKKVNVLNNDKAASHMGLDHDETRFQTLKSFFPNGVLDRTDFKIVMDSYRCKAFKFDRAETSIGDISFMYDEMSRLPSSATVVAPRFLGSGLILNHVQPPTYDSPLPNSPLAQLSAKRDNNDFTSTLKYFLGDKANIGPMAKDGPTLMPESNGPSANSVKPAKTDEPVKPTLGSGLTAPAQSAAVEKIKSASEETGTLTSNFANGFKQTAGALNNSDQGISGNQINSNFNAQTRTVIEREQFLNNSPARETKRPQSSEAASLNDKIADLTKKLNSSEENLERMRTEKVAEEVKAANLKKEEDEQKTIAELRDQIKNIRTESKKEVVATEEKIQPAVEVAEGTASLAKAAQTDSEITSVKAAAPVSAPHSEMSSVPQTSNNSSEATQSTALAKSFGAGAGISSAISNENRLSLVLSKTDSLSNEKIYEKIYELKGERFLIEEGGVVKEIKPLVVNNEIVKDKAGKPIFETVVLGDKNAFLKDKKAAKTSRKTAASLKSKADLLRDQEEKLKTEHAQYIKLKKITNDIWNKK